MGTIKNHVMPDSTIQNFFFFLNKWRYVAEDELSHHGLLKSKKQIPPREIWGRSLNVPHSCIKKYHYIYVTNHTDIIIFFNAWIWNI